MATAAAAAAFAVASAGAGAVAAAASAGATAAVATAARAAEAMPQSPVAAIAAAVARSARSAGRQRRRRRRRAVSSKDWTGDRCCVLTVGRPFHLSTFDAQGLADMLNSGEESTERMARTKARGVGDSWSGCLSQRAFLGGDFGWGP